VDQARLAVRSGITEQNLPGVSVAVGVGGEIVWAEGFGFADLDTKVPVAPEMRFRIAEVSKAFTSAAVGLLLEQQKLNLDDEIQTYVPEYPKKEWPVTLRQLMAQTAGVREDSGDEEPLHERCDRTIDALPRFARSSLRFEPGTKFSPSSYGWILVSAAVEAAARERFFSVMRAQVFEPLGMRDTRPDLTFVETVPDLVTFYFPRFGGDTRYGPQSVREGDHSCTAGATGFLSTSSDVVRFGMAMSAGTLLQPSTIALLQTPVRLRSGEETGYGLGWTVETLPLGGQPTRMAGHGTKKDFIGGSAYLMTFPERGLVVAVTTNISFADAKSIAAKVANAFADQ
jgi:CubicO group peptidase (beta-lactamase class C family)